MALSDDLNRLAAQDIVYLTNSVPGGASEVYRGRLRQALSGNWVFNTSTGQNGVVGFDLGQVGGMWSSSESPATGIQVSIPYMGPPQGPGMGPMPISNILLTTLIPQDFAD
jgi:hypothetical protein